MREVVVRCGLVTALAWALAGCGAEPAPTASCPEWFPDADGDGYGDGAAGVVDCDAPDGHVGNPYDCDDHDPAIHPLAQERCDPDRVDEDCDGLADNHDPNALGRSLKAWPDADGDGHAAPESETICALTEGWLPEPGRDCDDADAGIHPSADDPLDGVDNNCDHLDGPAIYDDFETGGPDPAMWGSHQGLQPTSVGVSDGDVAAELVGQDVLAESVAIDTSGCEAVAWHYLAMARYAVPAPQPIHLEFWDGAGWQALDTWDPDAVAIWNHRWGSVEDPSSLHPDFRVRWRASAAVGGNRSIDRIMIGCRFESDDDGVPDGIDCASDDPRHWFDCDLCQDKDGDGFGLNCDLGRDCDDADPSVHPGAGDVLGDEYDTDCTGLDGTDLFDDFATGRAGTAWHPLVNADVTGEEPHVPSYALLIQATGSAVTPPIDLSGCADGVWWEYLGWPRYVKGGALVVSWEGADGWMPIEAWETDGAGADYTRRWGALLDPEVATAGMRLRFDASRIWAIDDVHVACLIDVDGDDVHDPVDCAPDDPLHWFDCGVCVDGDGDGRGIDCDLGDDCDDARPDVYPHNPDALTDGVDQDCDGIDGVALLEDDFEPTGPDPALWTLVNNHAIVHWTPAPGPVDTYVKFYGGAGIMEAAPVDTTACARVGWRLEGRGVGAHVSGYELSVERWDGATWSEIDRWQAPYSPWDWISHAGSFGGPGAQVADLRIRLRAASISADRYVDVTEFALGCAEP